MLDYYDWIGKRNIDVFTEEEREIYRLFFGMSGDKEEMIDKYGGAQTTYDQKSGLVFEDESWKLEI